MRAVVLARHGGVELLRPTAVPLPVPLGDQVRVRVERIGVNYAEVLSRRGEYGWAPRLPYVPGMEAYGRIDAVGPEAARQVGEAVVVGAQHGCYAEQVVVPERQALPAIAGFSPEENAAFTVNYVTAWVALFEMARLRPTDRVLVQAAAGGVGTAALQLAKRFGCTVYGTAGSDEKLALLRGLGVDGAASYRRGPDARPDDLAAELRALVLRGEPDAGEGGIDVLLELVGGEAHRQAVQVLAPLGRVVVAGLAGVRFRLRNPLTWWSTWRALPRARLGAMARASQGVLATHVGYLLERPALLARVWRELVAFVEGHSIRPVLGATFDFDELPRAHALIESRRSVGKVVVRVG
jgi:NADPH2:quinone reductase